MLRMSNLIKNTQVFCNVALPAALPRVLTYRIPENTVAPEVGMRVVVPLGNRKLTGVVWSIHTEQPEGYIAKSIEAVVDDRPVVTERLTAMMSWMSSYYMCSLGDVVSTALPSGMKLASKTRILLNPDGGDESGLGESANLLLDALHLREGLNLKEVSDILGIKYPQRVVRLLIDKGLAITEEELKEKYKTKKLVFVAISKEVLEEKEVLATELDRVEKRAPSQHRALLAYLELAPHGEEVLKKTLQKHADVTSAVIKKWVQKEVFNIVERDISRLAAYTGKIQALPTLSNPQSTAYSEIRKSLVKRKPVLLNGVTGSGKTEIYVHLIAETIKAGQQALFLVPEIALTTQLITRLQKFFGDSIIVYHSRFNASERTEVWLKVLDEKKGALIVGPRSATFLPFSNLGLIIVDEEHESSYKQQDPAPRYNARDVAMWMSSTSNIPLVLGSATPSVETVYLSDEGKITRVNLTERYSGVIRVFSLL